MRPRLLPTLLLALTCALAGPVQSAVVRGTVTHVTDGDSLWLRPPGGAHPIEVRLLNLDAPEGCQPHGPQARSALSARVLRETVVLHTRGHDGYHRTLARVYHRGEDVGAWLVQHGHAWSTGSRRQPGPYARLEAEARRARLGLWSHVGAEEPRLFRKRHGRCER